MVQKTENYCPIQQCIQKLLSKSARIPVCEDHYPLQQKMAHVIDEQAKLLTNMSSPIHFRLAHRYRCQSIFISAQCSESPFLPFSRSPLVRGRGGQLWPVRDRGAQGYSALTGGWTDRLPDRCTDACLLALWESATVGGPESVPPHWRGWEARTVRQYISAVGDFYRVPARVTSVHGTLWC